VAVEVEDPAVDLLLERNKTFKEKHQALSLEN
jgi:hypothetical protein